jgi:polyisoprenoid-binding protein YceI
MPALAVTAFALTASAGLPEVSGSKVEFHAVGPGGLAIDGTGEAVTVEKGKKDGSVAFKTSLQNLKTGMSLRDKHLKKYIDVEHWPNASMTLDESKLKDAASGKELNGTLKLHGVEKSVKVKYTAKKAGGGHHVDANFDVFLPDFKIEQPCYLGVCVDKTVKVTVHFDIKN